MKHVQQLIVAVHFHSGGEKTVASVVDHMISQQFFDRHLFLQGFLQQFRLVGIGIYGIDQDTDIVQSGFCLP